MFYLSSCSEDSLEEKNPRIGCVTVTLTSGEAETRTNLTTTSALQNVETVYIALYKGNNRETASFVECRDFEWDNTLDKETGGKQTRTFSFSGKVTAGEEYIILAVGLDAESKTTYGFASLTDFQNKLNNKTLAQAEAVCAEAGAVTISRSELFSGWNSFVFDPDIENKIQVEIRRRVAGVLCYMKDIPYEINGSLIYEVRLVLNQNQRNTISLAAPDAKDAIDFGTGELPDSRVLGSVRLLAPEGETPPPSIVGEGKDDKGLWKIQKSYTDALHILPNTLLIGSYVLPIQKTNSADATLSIELLDGTGKPVISFPLTTKDGGNIYSIEPNKIYHLGDKKNPLGVDDYDFPISVAGSNLQLTVSPWNERDVDVIFPNVPIYSRMEYKNSYNESTYVFDCVNTEDLLTIYPSLLKKKWKLTVLYDNPDKDPDYDKWIYIKNGDQYVETYESTLDESGKNVTLTFRINDFVKYRDPAKYNPNTVEGQKLINGDCRKAYFILVTEGAEKNPQTLVVRQYNAFTVSFVSGKEEYRCGISRYDLEQKRNPDGTLVEKGKNDRWGFFQTTPFYIYGSESNKSNSDERGLLCYQSANEKGQKDGWNGSALQFCWKDGWVFDGTTDVSGTTDWCLTARMELQEFFKQYAVHKNIKTNVNVDGFYWSATAKGGSRTKTYYQKMGTLSGENILETTDLDSWAKRDTYGYFRQVREFLK